LLEKDTEKVKDESLSLLPDTCVGISYDIMDSGRMLRIQSEAIAYASYMISPASGPVIPPNRPGQRGGTVAKSSL
jgi:hypothetical protein